MRRRILSIILTFWPVFVIGQGGAKSSADSPDLGLHGTVTWLSDTKIRVEYDWSDDSQLLDWTPTHRSNFVRGNGSLTITGGNSSVRSMVWKQLIRCTRILAEDARAVNSTRAHLNFITNVTGWFGDNFNPPEIIGLIYVADGNYWLENGSLSSLSSPHIVLGEYYTSEVNISETEITAKSSADNVAYSHNLASPPDYDRQVAVGGWGGDTEWGKLIIEGELNPETLQWQTPSGTMNIQTWGSLFSPVIEVTGNPLIEWIFDDNSISSSAAPVKDYGSAGLRNNLLRVTPWSAVTGINLGYDAADGGYGGFAMVGKQNIHSIQNLDLVKNNLIYLCASYSPLTELDLRGFTAIRFVELFLCHNLSALQLDSHPLIERLCLEECNLADLNISGCPSLKDIRGSSNRYTSINWGSTGSHLWHICVRSNPQFVSNLPDLSVFPSLTELLTWDDNQTGSFICHNSLVDRIDSYDNHYTSADISGCNNLTQLTLSGSKLTALNLGTANNLIFLKLKDCWLDASLVDYVLSTLDNNGKLNGYIELIGNAPPSGSGLDSRNNLLNKGWTVLITDPDQTIQVSRIEVSGSGGQNTINIDKGSLQLNASVLPSYVSNNSVTWSVINGTGQAVISAEGLVSAGANGTVTVRATANDGSGVYGELTISISGQTIPEEESIVPVITGNEMKISLNSNYIAWKANVFNLRGDLVLSKIVDSDVVTFDISSLPPGIVIVVLEKGRSLRVAKTFIP